MKIQSIGRWDREVTLVAQLAAAASLLAFLFYFRHRDLLLYGDAVAHINIARRVFDSRTPGLLQLGTVWLPLPHLLMIPFLLSDSGWQTGIGGAIPSMCAYVFGVVGMFRLVRGVLSGSAAPEPSARIAAWLAAAIYAANPNLLYLQTTAMTESIYLALFVWAVVHFSEFVQAANPTKADARLAGPSLVKCGWCLAGACLTRYDGWLLAVVIGLAALFVIARARGASMRGSFSKFVLLAAAAPVLWLGYNAIVYHNPLEFANGPYSARAIERKNATPGMTAHPGSHDLPAASSFFLKSAQLNVVEGNWGRLWLGLLLAGTLASLGFLRQTWPLLLFWVPLPFYILSVAYGGVPIFLPVWWPFSYYNTRYGLELLPAFVVFVAISVHFLFGLARNKSTRTSVGLAFALLLVGSYVAVWRALPICYREAHANSRTRMAFEAELAVNLGLLPHDSTLLMYLGDHVGALQRAGIPLRRVINEGNHRPWQHPSDPEGLWEKALANPRENVDYVVAMDGDPVASAVQKRDLTSVVVIKTTGQPRATFYWTHRSDGNHTR